MQSLTKQYVTLVTNPDYNWGPKPKIAKITVRFIADQTAQVQALENGELSVLYGQATADTVKSLQGASGIKSTTTPTATLRAHRPHHRPRRVRSTRDLRWRRREGSRGSPGVLRGRSRVPRCSTRLIKPLSSTPSSTTRRCSSRVRTGYDEATKANGFVDYDKVDVEGAKALLAQAGVTGTVDREVRVRDGQPASCQGEFQLLQASADLAGFNVVDVGKPGSDFFGDSGLGRASTTTTPRCSRSSSARAAVTGNQGAYQRVAASNYQGYSNKEVDDLWQDALAATRHRGRASRLW